MREQRVKNPQDLIDDYKSGLPVSELADKYGISEAGIYYYLRRYDVKNNRYGKSEPKPTIDIEGRKKKLRARREKLIEFILGCI